MVQNRKLQITVQLMGNCLLKCQSYLKFGVVTILLSGDPLSQFSLCHSVLLELALGCFKDYQKYV